VAATPFSFPPPRCVPPDLQPLHATTSSFPPRCTPGLGERGDGGHVGDTCDDLAEPGPADPAVAEEGVEPPRRLEVGTADPHPCRPCCRIGDAQGRPPQSRLSLTCPTVPWRHSSQAPNCPTITTPASLACLRPSRRHHGEGGHSPARMRAPHPLHGRLSLWHPRSAPFKSTDFPNLHLIHPMHTRCLYYCRNRLSRF